MRLWQTNPFHKVVLTRGAGSTVWDSSGKPYLDLLSGTWCNILGYGHPRWLAAIREQVAKLTHVGASLFAEEIDHALPKLQDEGLIEAAARQGAFMMKGLRDLQAKCPSIAEVRGKGAMLGSVFPALCRLDSGNRGVSERF